MQARFESNRNLISLQEKLEQLNKKCQDLESEDKQFFSFLKDTKLINQKYKTLITLNEEVNHLIEQFNALQKKENELDETKDLTKLIVRLHEQVSIFIKLNQDILNKPTDSGKSLGENSTYYGGKLAVIGGLYATGGLSLLPTAIGWYGSSRVSSKVNKQLGFSTKFTHTMTVLNELQAELEKIYQIFAEILSRHGLEPEMKLQLAPTPSDLISNTVRTIVEMLHANRATSNPSTNSVTHDNFSEATNSYITNTKKEFFLEQLSGLKLGENEQPFFEEFKDPITAEYMNIPVRLNGSIFNLDTLLKISSEADGKRKDPFNNFHFYLCHIQEARDIANKMTDAIALVKKEREDKKLSEQEQSHQIKSETLSSNVISSVPQSLFYTSSEQGSLSGPDLKNKNDLHL